MDKISHNLPRFTANFPKAIFGKGLGGGPFPFELTDRDWLISINDAAAFPPELKQPFDRVATFFFDDESNPEWPGIMPVEDAVRMADFIKEARDLNKNVWAHCHAGICRSGAVVEVLSLLGWTVADDHSPRRIPNTHVFKLLRLQFDELKNSWELDAQVAEKGYDFYHDWLNYADSKDLDTK
jgi:rhodanese-related sulfurtransferase